MFYGLFELTWWQYILVALALTHLSIICVTVFLHRSQAHRSLDLHPAISHVFRLWLWLATGMKTKDWAAIHRKHHARCETKEDPHSPQVLGLPIVLWQGAELYRKEAVNDETLERFGKGTPDDWLERHIYSPHSGKGLFLMLFIDLLLFGVPGAAIWATQMVWIPFFAAGIINGVGHYWGYRNFECPDAARNIIPFGILIGGEELHNNHHTFPTSAKLSAKWWEFDIGWLYIKILSFLGLAKIKRSLPKEDIIAAKPAIDSNGLTCIISNRIQIMTTYIKTVIHPAFQQEKLKFSGKELKKFKRLKFPLMRSESIVDDSCKQQLEQELVNLPALQQVYEFKKNLQEIWSRTTASQKELIEALHEWCHHAEASGVKALQDFAAYLKGYSLKQV